MRNVTITVEDEVARWARVFAAQHDTSVSRLLGEMLRERMLEERAYETAMQAYVERKALPLGRVGEGYPSRDEVHER